MFVLRTIYNEKEVSNKIIGDQYNIVDRFVNPEFFRDIFKHVFGRDHVADLDETSDEKTKLCGAFIGSAPEWIPLFKNNQHYVMMDNGKTFEKIVL